MKKQIKERRKYERYETELEVLFHVKYNLETKVSFQLIRGKVALAGKYMGVTRNVSAEGLRFNSSRKLTRGNQLYLEIFLPEQRKPIYMTGEVRWSKKLSKRKNNGFMFDTGVKLITVGRRRIAPTVHFEKKYGVYWSIVLDTIFSSFKKIVRKHQIVR